MSGSIRLTGNAGIRLTGDARYAGSVMALDFAASYYRMYGAGGVVRAFERVPGASVTRASGGYASDTSGALSWYATRTNLAQRSQTFDNATWTKTNVTITADATTAPDGTVTADCMTLDAGTVQKYISSNIPSSGVGSVVVFSVYAKAGTHEFLQLANAGAATYYANFNLSTGVVGSAGANTNAAIFDAGGGWYRCVVYFNGGGPYNNSNRCQAVASATAAYVSTLSATGVLYLWGAQLETNPLPAGLTALAGTYIPTTTAAVTALQTATINAGLTVQQVRTNLLLRSQQFDNASWTKTNVTVTADAIAAPDGTTTADKVEATTSAATTLDQITTGGGSTLGNTASIYVKQGSGATDANAFTLRDVTAGTNLLAVTVNYSTGAITYVTGTTGATMTDVGNGWWRLTMTAAAATTGNNMRLYACFDGGAETAGEYAYVWGAQLEPLPGILTPYIRTGANLILQSQTFDNASWTKQRSSITADVVLAPNGTWTGDKLVEDTTVTNSHRVLQAVTTTAVPYTFSVSAKAAERTWIYLRLYDSVPTSRYVWFNLATGVVGTTGTGITASIVSQGNGWYRCIATISAAIAGANDCIVGLATGDNVETYTGDGTSGAYLWGAQLEAAGTVSTYDATTSAAITTVTVAQPRQTNQGVLVEESRTNVALWCRDLTQSAWTKSNTTAVLNQTGADGAANAATLLTATAGNGTCLQAITLASSARAQSAYVKRVTGSGTIQMTMDNGTTWTAITVTSAYTQLSIPTQTLANPTVGFRIVTSGDAIAVDFVQNENGTVASSPIPTTTASATRAADIDLTNGLNIPVPYTLVTKWLPYFDNAASFRRTGSLRNAALTAENTIYQRHTTNAAGVLVTTDVDLAIGTANAASLNKAAARFQTNDVNGALNGVAGTADTSATPTTATSLAIGSGLSGANPVNGYIQSIVVYPTAYTDSQLQAASA